MGLSNGGLIVIGIVIVLIIAGIVGVIFFGSSQPTNLPVDNTKPVVIPVVDTNKPVVKPVVDTNKPVAVPAGLCNTLDPKTKKLLAVVSDTNTPTVVSVKGGASPFFLLYKAKTALGSLANVEQAHIDAKSGMSLAAIAASLKGKNVEAVVLQYPTKAFVDMLQSRQITCYYATGSVATALGLATK